MGRAAWQRRVEVTFLFFPMDGETHPHNRQRHGQQECRQHKPRPLMAWWIFILSVHANGGSGAGGDPLLPVKGRVNDADAGCF